MVELDGQFVLELALFIEEVGVFFIGEVQLILGQRVNMLYFQVMVESLAW